MRRGALLNSHSQPVKRWNYLLGGLLVLLAVATSAAQQYRNITVEEMRREKRVALVIGNAAYETGRLNNPVNDARAVARALKGLGFEVLVYENVNNVQFRRAVAEFGEKLTNSGAGLFYYSGHGLQVGGKNYMIPLTADIKSERYVAVETVDVDSVLAQMDSAKNRLNIVILDACRDNPFARRFRSASRGLASMDAPTGTFVAYATAPGSTADDGEPGQNGIYTAELLKALREPGLKIEDVFKRTLQGVLTRTSGRQNPWVASSLTGDFVFSMTASLAPPPRPSEPPRYEPPKITIQEEIRQQLGTVALSTRLDGVEVWLDDRKIGETRSGRALVVSNLPEGPHRIRARKTGYKDWERDVQVNADMRTEVTIDIEPLRTDPPKIEPRVKRVLFEDDFIRRKDAWVGDNNICNARYADVGYLVTNTSPKGTCEPSRSMAGVLADNVRIELSVTLRAGATNHLFGLKFARPTLDNNENYMIFGINGDGSWRLAQYQNNDWKYVIDWTSDSGIKTGHGATNHLAVEVSGRRVRCYINDKFLSAGTALSDTKGYIGMFLNTPGMEVSFTNLKVAALD